MSKSSSIQVLSSELLSLHRFFGRILTLRLRGRWADLQPAACRGAGRQGECGPGRGLMLAAFCDSREALR